MKPSLILGPGAFRLILAFVVVIHHSFPLRLGAWAVYLFFMLSGYWIARMWFAKYRETRQPLLTFYVSRWWRLAPVFLFCSLLGLLLKAWIGDGTFPTNWVEWLARQIPIAGSASRERVLPPTWSLDVEMQFYLLAPFLLWGLWKLPPKLGWVFALLATAFSAVHFYFGGSAEAPYLWPYLGLFICGIFIARTQWRPKNPLIWGGILTFVLSTLLLFNLPNGLDGLWQRGADATSETGIHTSATKLWWIWGAVFCIPFVAWNVRQISGPMDRWMGNLAYPLYLFHWIPREGYYALVDWNKPIWWNGSLLLANVVAAFLGAILVLKYVDTPFDRLRAKWTNSRKPYPSP